MVENSEILDFLKLYPGCNNKQIAQYFEVSEWTIKRHLWDMEDYGLIYSITEYNKNHIKTYYPMNVKYSPQITPETTPSEVGRAIKRYFDEASKFGKKFGIVYYDGLVRIIQNETYNLLVWLNGELKYRIVGDLDKVVTYVRLLYDGTPIDVLNMIPTNEIVEGTKIYEKTFTIKGRVKQ